MSLSRRVGANAAGQVGGRLYTSSLAFVIAALVLPRQLGEHAFGVFAFYLSLYQLLTNVLGFGAGTIVIREASRKREDAGRLIGMLVIIKASIASVAALGMIAVAWTFEGPGIRFAVLTLATLQLLFHAPAGAAAIFHVDMDFKWSVLAAAAGQTAWLLGTLVLALLGVTSPAPYVAAYGLGPVVNGTLSYAWASRRVKIRFDAGRAALARLWSQAWPAGISMTMASVYFFIDTSMLRPLAGEVATAHYSAAYRLMTFVLMVPVLFSQVIFPVYSRLWTSDRRSLQAFFERTLGFLLALGILVPATAPWVADAAMGLVYPSSYLVGSDCLRILCLAVVAVFVAYPHVMLLLATGHQRVMMAVSTAAAVLNVVANLWAIPRFGIEGAAWTTVATEGFVVASAAIASRRLTGVALPAVRLVRPLLCAAVAAAVMAVAEMLLPPDQRVLRVAVGVGVAAVGVLAMGVLPLDLGTDDGAPATTGTSGADTGPGTSDA